MGNNNNNNNNDNNNTVIVEITIHFVIHIKNITIIYNEKLRMNSGETT